MTQPNQQIRILFLDDSSNRYAVFQAKLKLRYGDDVFVRWVTTPTDCIRALQTEDPWDFICLDGDLLDYYTLKKLPHANDISGHHVTHWIHREVQGNSALKTALDRAIFVIHTFSPYKQSVMARSLLQDFPGRVKKLPFGTKAFCQCFDIAFPLVLEKHL